MIDADAFADALLDLVDRADRAKAKTLIRERFVGELVARSAPATVVTALVLTEIKAGLLAPSAAAGRARDLEAALAAPPAESPGG